MDIDININNDPVASLAKEFNNLTAEEVALRKEMEELQKRLSSLHTKSYEIRNKKSDLQIKIHDSKRRLENEKLLAERQKLIEQEADVMKSLADEVVSLFKDNENFKKLHPYQVEDIVSGVAAYKNDFKGLLNANDMGMGKTAESAFLLSALSHYLTKENGKKPKILWLTKKSLFLKGSTKRELEKWCPDLKIMSPNQNNNNKTMRGFMVELFEKFGLDIFLCNYEYVRTTPEIAKIDWDIVAIDEVHKLKGGANPNGPTAIWKAVKDICINAEYVLMLSGTPMVNAAEEMWSYLHIFSPDRFPSIKMFRQNFMEYKRLAGEFTDRLTVNPGKIMQQALKGQMIRRSAQEVGLELPELNYNIVELDMHPTQRTIYKQMLENFYIWLEDKMDEPLTATAILAQLIRLRQINVWPHNIKFQIKNDEGEVVREEVTDCPFSSKIDEAMEIIENVQDQVVVFSTFNEPFVEIKRRCKELGLRCEVINGSDKLNFDPEAEFQQGKIDVLCINSAMGEGLNLQKNPSAWPGGASYGIMLDLWWSPARNDQCVARIHRQGSNIPVFFYELRNLESIDNFLVQLNEDKKAEFDSIMTSNEIRPGKGWKEYLEQLLS